MNSEESAPPRHPSAAESIAALRARVAAANAAGNAATAAAIASNNEVIAANEQGLHDLNERVANGPQPDPDLLRNMFPDQHS